MAVLKLTVKQVEKLIAPDPSGKQAVHWDSELKGFGVLCSGVSNSKTYIAQRVLPGGRTRRITVGAVAEITLDEARERAADTLDCLRRGVDPKRRVHIPTVKETMEDYFASRKDLRPATLRVYRTCVERYLKPWLDTPIHEITSDMVEERHAAIAAEVADEKFKRKGGSAANLTMRVFRTMYNFVADRVPAMPPNPVRRLKRQWFPERRREKIVRSEDMPKFYEAVNGLDNAVARDLLLLILFSGLRVTEASSLRWEDVDLPLRVVRVKAGSTKADRKLDLPMSDAVRDMLIARRSVGDAKFVFPGEDGHIRGARNQLDAIAEQTGVRVSHHDLRRTYITVAESADISPMALKLLVNHSVGSDVTGGYVIMNQKRLAEAAQTVADEIKKLCGVPPIDAENVARLAG